MIDLTIGNYSCTEVLLNNEIAGRTTYLAKDRNKNNVVLKSFEFNNPRSSWSAFKSLEKEVEFLKRIEHSQIPKYLDYFQTENGFVLVTEYIDAANLSYYRKRFKIKEVLDIAKQVLKILVYLQGLNPPVIHRDIKPSNILLDRSRRAYLIDFGIATAANHTMTLTSTIGGTLGFSAPEILRGRTAMLNSDLYSLGVTLFCLLKNIFSRDVNNYIKADFSLDWNKLNLDVEVARWLKYLSHPDWEKRFSSPIEAIASLEDLDNYLGNESEVSDDDRASSYMHTSLKSLTPRPYREDNSSNSLQKLANHTSDSSSTPKYKHGTSPYFKKGRVNPVVKRLDSVGHLEKKDLRSEKSMNFTNSQTLIERAKKGTKITAWNIVDILGFLILVFLCYLNVFAMSPFIVWIINTINSYEFNETWYFRCFWIHFVLLGFNIGNVVSFFTDEDNEDIYVHNAFVVLTRFFSLLIIFLQFIFFVLVQINNYSPTSNWGV